MPILELTDATERRALAKMRDGELDAVLVVPAGLGVMRWQPGAPPAQPFQLIVYTDPSQQTSSNTVQQVVAQVVGGINQSLSGPTAGARRRATSRSRSQDITAAAYFVPSILAMALMQLGIFAAIPLVAQREKGILKRLSATPLSRTTLVGSNVIMRLLIALVQTVIIVGIGIALFGVEIVGSLAVVAFFIVLGATAFLASVTSSRRMHARRNRPTR